jgi:hypothetical protein
MDTPNVVDLCDTIADDLADIARAIAPDYMDWRHMHPDVLQAENAPWLAVYSPATTHLLVATPGQFFDDDEITIEWAVSIASDDQGGVDTPAVVRDAILAAAPFLDRLKSYAEGLPGLGNQLVGTLASTARATDVGLVWRQTSRLVVNTP